MGQDQLPDPAYAFPTTLHRSINRNHPFPRCAAPNQLEAVEEILVRHDRIGNLVLGLPLSVVPLPVSNRGD